MSRGAGDGFEGLGYFVGFWAFLFNRGFREAWPAEFKTENALCKCLSLIEAVSAVLFGLVLPVLILYGFAWKIAILQASIQ